ncbi:RNHCP domain-containing protein [Candidatus Poribacteria bacterium]|nr:RNHCP domain-containing protein [Candidatus Poribacteria bacterium]MXV85842.1 RNHCP domain-containing protein [Candidatus Poribacteria bacterium]
MNKKFQRHIENFTCVQCGAAVEGNGYTNHCPECLWSRHVDVNPGDRAASCLGLMEPVGFTIKHGDYILTHRCTTCGIEKKNKTSKNDNFEAILNLQGELNNV